MDNNTIWIVGLIVLGMNVLVRIIASVIPDDATEQIMPSHALPTLPPPPPQPSEWYYEHYVEALTETQKIHVMRSKERYVKCSHCGQPGSEMSTCTHCGAQIYYN